MKKIIAMLLALVMVFALVACGTTEKPVESQKPAESQQPAESQKPAESQQPEVTPEPTPEITFDGEIVFGHIADLTGVESLTGAESVASMDFAVKLINEAGGIAGKKVVVIHEDAKSSTPEAKNAAQKLIENNKVVAILGPTQAGHKGAVGGIVTELKVPAVYYNATPFGMIKGNAYIISAGGGTNQLPTCMADYVYNDMGWRKVYTITQDNQGGYNYMNPFIDNFTAMGGEVVESMWVAAGVSDLTSYLSKMSNADGIVGWLSNADGIKLWTTWYELGLDKDLPMVSSMHGGFTDYYILDSIAQTNPEVVDAILECAVAPVAYSYLAENEVNKAFVEAYTKEFGHVPLATNLPGAIYGAMLLVKEAAEKVEGEITSEALYQAFFGCDIESPEGRLAFAEADDRSATKDIYIVKPIKTDAGYNYEILKEYKDVSPMGLKVG